MAETVEIVGFRYPGGYLRYSGGMLAIYGQNGAGKSLLLEAIESSLAGRPVGRTPANRFESFDVVHAAAIARAKFTDLGLDFGDSRTIQSPEQFQVGLQDAADQDWYFDERPELGAAWAGLIRELSRDEFAVVVPSGNAEARWTSFAAVEPFSPAVEAWRAAVEAQFELSLAGKVPIDRDAAFVDWCNETADQYMELEWQVTNLNGVLTDGGQFRFNGYSRTFDAPPFGGVITESSLDPDADVSRWVAAALREPVEYASDGSSSSPRFNAQAIAERLAPTAVGWTDRVNDLMQRFLLDPPVLRLVLGEPVEWVSGALPHWESVSGAHLEMLSDAEKRWSRIAIALAAPDKWSVLDAARDGKSEVSFAIDEDSELPAPILLIDEPEKGLHRAAEVHLAAGLLSLAGTDRVRPILATHSPAILDAGQGQVFEIKKRKRGGIGDVVELLPSEIEELKSFGLQPSSLLHVDRGYLLVEGEHDKQIIEGWFGDELRSTRVAVLAMRGTRNLWTVFDSEFLIERTDALLMPLLDDIALDPLFDLWAQAEAAAGDGRRSDAAGVLRRGMSKIPGGAKDVYEPLLTGAITRGVSQRFFPLGMSKKDVLEYLPVGELIEGAGSWADLRREWNKSPAAMADRSGKAYKDWLRKVKRADFSPENLRLIAETTAPHPELKAIFARISERLS